MNSQTSAARSRPHRDVGEEAYARSVLQRYAVDTTPHALPMRVVDRVLPALRDWAGPLLETSGIRLIGACARAAAVRTDGDMDLMIPMRKDAGELGAIHDSIWRLADAKHWTTWPRAVSRRMALDDVMIDLIPVLVDPEAECPHEVFFFDRQVTARTNLDLHVALAKEADCAEIVRLVKIWRDVQGLSLPTLHLELLTYEALADEPSGTLIQRFHRVLNHLASPRILQPMNDPANPENIVSAGSSREQKHQTATCARWSVESAHLTEVLR